MLLQRLQWVVTSENLFLPTAITTRGSYAKLMAVNAVVGGSALRAVSSWLRAVKAEVCMQVCGVTHSGEQDAD